MIWISFVNASGISSLPVLPVRRTLRAEYVRTPRLSLKISKTSQKSPSLRSLETCHCGQKAASSSSIILHLLLSISMSCPAFRIKCYKCPQAAHVSDVHTESLRKVRIHMTYYTIANVFLTHPLTRKRRRHLIRKRKNRHIPIVRNTSMNNDQINCRSHRTISS